MESSLAPLLPLYERERAAGRSLVLGVVLETAGSTYRKPGALMLIAADGDYAGLLSGGCLEGDLREHANTVRQTGVPRVVSYDLRGPDDLLWGLGVGCEGAMNILLLRVSAENDWQPIHHFHDSLNAYRTTAVGIVVEAGDSGRTAGEVIFPHAGATSTAQPLTELELALFDHATRGRAAWVETSEAGARIFGLPNALPPRVLLLGAGPDTLPIVDFAARLGWKVTLVDHRSAYAQAARFPSAERVVLTRPDEFLTHVDTRGFNAAVVMSHHLPSDLLYLQALSRTEIPYVGLLGPAIRREKLLTDMGEEAAQALRPRLRAPVGLALGGRAPESIALAIIAEIHASVHGSEGGPFRGSNP